MSAHPELVGMRTTQLPSQSYSKYDNSEGTSIYTYTLDKDGYVESCTEKSLSNNTRVYTFKWE